MSYTIKNSPLTWRQIRIVAVASLGQLIGTGLATLVSVIIPLYQLIAHPELSSAMQGLVGAMDLIGIMVGSTILGKLSDRYGYLLLFRLCPLLILMSSVAALIFPHISVLIVCLFLMGFGIGGEYSLDSDYISELMPQKWTFIMVGAAKAASAMGNIIVALICFLVVKNWTSASAWPTLLWIMIGISSLMLICRIRFWESPTWLAAHGKMKEAEIATHNFLGNDVDIEPSPQVANKPVAQKDGFFSFVSKNWKNVIFTGVPWACEGLGVYGIGVFLPILVMALGLEHSAAGGNQIAHVASSIEITLWISCIILPGFVIGLFLIPKMNGAKQQTMGFLMSGVSLLILLFAYRNNWPHWISIGAFMFFELFLNIGPHLMTYVLPSKVFPVEVRGQGSGIAASIGKLGAVLGVFFIPILLKSGGSSLVLVVSIIVMIIGALVTYAFAPDHKI
ncbi:MAG: MFS transporter [Muribaculaceae bacterium]|nr:MFS transporter [Muribaculaceae bacterium]MDE6754321.1 MFS transporter [Muribaculaceae bacterium]